MSRYIDADALIQLGLKDGAYEYVSVQEIADFPTADVVEVVRCKDCYFAEPIKESDGFYTCTSGLLVGENHFCSYGKRGKDEINSIINAKPKEMVEVVHGEWIPIDVGDCCYRCSVCNFVRDAYLLEEDNYCPHCGAKMDL